MEGLDEQGYRLSDGRLRRIAAIGLLAGALLGMTGGAASFVAGAALWAVSLAMFGWSIYIRDARINDGGIPWFTSGWRVAGLREPAPFFQNVQLLLPPGALLVLDGAFMANDVKEFVQGRTVEPQAQLASGTLWPRSQMHWLMPTSETLSGLVTLSSNHASPEICEHLYAVLDGRLILIWTDAFSDPLMISAELPADSVAAFGRAVKLQPEQWEGP